MIPDSGAARAETALPLPPYVTDVSSFPPAAVPGGGEGLNGLGNASPVILETSLSLNPRHSYGRES